MENLGAKKSFKEIASKQSMENVEKLWEEV